MARKAMKVLSVNAEHPFICKVEWAVGRTSEYALRHIDRNTLLTIAKQLGHKFDPKVKSALSYTQWELRTIVENILSNKTGVIELSMPTPTQPERPIVRVDEPVKVTKPSVAIGGNAVHKTSTIEEALRTVITEALADVNTDPSSVDMTAVKQMLDEAVTGIRSETQKSVEALTTLVNNSRPTVTNISLSGGKTTTITGRKHFMFEQVLKVVDLGLSPWLTGGAGVGKTTIAEQVAKALDLEYSPESFCSQSSKAEVKGYNTANGLYMSTEFRQRFEYGGVYLLDEVDAANPNILLALNSALSNGYMAFPDKVVKKHEKFIAIACANTYGNGATAEYVGRQVIDGATLNRFVKLDIPIDLDMEAGIVNDVSSDKQLGDKWLRIIRQARRNVETHGLKVIVSPRDSIHGAKLLGAGFTLQQVVPMTFGSGMKRETYQKVMGDISLV